MARSDKQDGRGEDRDAADAPAAVPKVGLGERAQQWLGRWIDIAQRRAIIIVAVCAVLGALMMAYTAANLTVDTDTANMLSAKLPWRQAGAELDRLFPQQSHELTVVIDGDTPERAAEAQLKLVAALKANPDLYVDVFALDADPFFRRNGLLFLDTEQVRKLSDALLQAQPFLGTLAHEPSLHSLFTLLQRAVSSPEAQGFDLAPALKHIGDSIDGAARGRSRQMSWQDLTNTGIPDLGNPRRRFIEINPRLDFSEMLPAQDAIDGVRDLAAGLHLDAAHHLKVRLTGPVALEHEELVSAGSGAILALGVGFVLMIAMLFLALRRWQLVVAAVFTLFYGLVATATFAAATVGHLNMISVVFGVLYIGLGIDYALYLCMQYRERLRAATNASAALTQSARDVGSFLVVCALTTSIGFFAFIPTAFTGIAELGLISGAGMFISLLLSLSLLPALIALLPMGASAAEAAARAAIEREAKAAAGKPRSPAAASGKHAAEHEAPVEAGSRVKLLLNRGMAFLVNLPYAHTRSIWIAAGVLGAGALALAPFVRFDYDPLNLRDPHTESVSTFRDLLKDPSVPTLTLSLITSGAPQAATEAAKLGKLPLVKQTLSLADFLPSDQAAKLAIIEDLNFALGPDLAGTPPDKYVGDDKADLQALEDLRAALTQVIGAREDDLAKALKTLNDDLIAFDAAYSAVDPDERPKMLARLRDNLLGALPSMLASLHDSLQASAFTQKDLPPDLLHRWVSEDGHYRVDIWPRQVLDTPAALQGFVDQVRAAEPGVAGAPIEYLESGHAVVKSFQQAFAFSVVAITVLLLILLRSFADMLLVLVPLVLAGLLTLAGSVLFRVPFNFANVIALPLILGVGVDYGVYIVQNGRAAATSEINLLKTASARAVFYGALITVANFGNLALSSHPGTRSMGIILSVGLAMTLFCSLILLPGLLAARARRAAAAAASAKGTLEEEDVQPGRGGKR